MAFQFNPSLALWSWATRLAQGTPHYHLSDEASIRKRMARVRLESRIHCFEYMYVTTKGEMSIPEC